MSIISQHSLHLGDGRDQNEANLSPHFDLFWMHVSNNFFDEDTNFWKSMRSLYRPVSPRLLRCNHALFLNIFPIFISKIQYLIVIFANSCFLLNLDREHFDGEFPMVWIVIFGDWFVDFVPENCYVKHAPSFKMPFTKDIDKIIDTNLWNDCFEITDLCRNRLEPFVQGRICSNIDWRRRLTTSLTTHQQIRQLGCFFL